jgi:hypothetical protein
MIVGNGFDSMDQLCLLSVESSILQSSVCFVEKKNLLPAFKSQEVIPVEFLKDTKWEGRKSIVAMYALMVLPLQFGMVPPSGSIKDAQVKNAIGKLGGEFKAWYDINLQAHVDYEDIQLVLTRMLDSDKFETYIEKGITSPTNAPYSMLSIVEDFEAYPDAISELKKVFGKEKQSDAPRATASTQNILSIPSNLVLARPEDEEKLTLNQRSEDKLAIFLAKSDISFGAFTGDFVLEKPEWSESWKQVLSVKGKSLRITEAQGTIESAFSDDLTADMENANNIPSALKTARSIIHFGRQASGQLLKANLSTNPASSIIQDSTTLNPLAFAYQMNTGQQVDVEREREMKHDAEETYNIPENQRSEKSASIKVIGSLANLDHVIGLLANLCTIFAIIAAISSAPNTAKPIIYTVYMYLFNFISMPNFKLWATKHWSAHPFLHPTFSPSLKRSGSLLQRRLALLPINHWQGPVTTPR